MAPEGSVCPGTVPGERSLALVKVSEGGNWATFRVQCVQEETYCPLEITWLIQDCSEKETRGQWNLGLGGVVSLIPEPQRFRLSF